MVYFELMLNLYLFTCQLQQFDFQKHENRKENKNKVKIRKMLEKRNTVRVLEWIWKTSKLDQNCL